MGQILQRLDYKPFGSVLATAGTGARTGYINREEDGETGLGSCGVRLYEPEYGRFTSVDVLWVEYGAFQPYHYSFNSPMVFSDVSGLGPADFFLTMDAAAQDWVDTFGEQLATKSIEYGSRIGKLRLANGLEVFTYNEPETQGYETGVTPELLQVSEATKEFGSELVEIGRIHNHPPSSDESVKSNSFSDADKGLIYPYTGQATYVLTPDAGLLKYDHAKQSTSEVTTQVNGNRLEDYYWKESEIRDKHGPDCLPKDEDP